MIRIANQLIKHKQKSSLLLIGIIALSLALMLATGPMFDTAKAQIFDAYASRYGLQHGAIFYLDADKIEILRQKQEELCYALFSNYGKWRLSETQQDVTLGWLSEEAVELGQLRLLEGVFPQAEDELALEQNAVRYKCPPGTKLGDLLEFEQDGVRKQFRLVGILADYVGNWESFEDDSLIEGVNDFPRGLLGNQSSPTQETRGALLYFWHYDALREDPPISALSRELNQTTDFTYDYVVNDLLYYQVETAVLQPFASFRLLMLFVVLLGGSMILFVSLGLYIQRFLNTYYMLFTLGAGKREVGKLYAGQCLLLLLAGAVLGIGCAQGIAWIYGAVYGVQLQIFTLRNFLWPAVALAAMVAFAGLAFRLSICPLAEKSISQRKPQRTKEALPVSRRLLFSLSQSSIQSNFKRLIPVLVVILFLVSAMGIAGVYSGQFQMHPTYEFAFSVSASGSYSSVQVYPFELSNWKNNLFPIRQSEELQNVPGVLHVQYQNYTSASMVIPVAQSAYWGQFTAENENEVYGEEKFTAEAVIGAPTQGVTVLTNEELNYAVTILTSENLAEYQAAYPDLPIERMREQGGVALILPPIVSEDPTVPDISYDTLQVGDMLQFGSLEYGEAVRFSDASKDPSLLTYQEWQYPICYITETPKETDRGYRRVQTERPTVLILEETNAENPLVKGRIHLFIVTVGTISEADYDALEAKVRQIALSNPGSVVQSAREEREQNQELMRIVNLSLGMILGVFGVFTVIAIYSALYMTILRRKRSLAIYRALGLPRWKLAMAMLLELLFYWLLAILLAFVVSMIAFHAIWHITSLPYMGMPMMRVLVLALLAGLPLNGFIVWSLQRNIYSESVYAAMRLGE